jgi:hypothetical protein
MIDKTNIVANSFAGWLYRPYIDLGEWQAHGGAQGDTAGISCNHPGAPLPWMASDRSNPSVPT